MNRTLTAAVALATALGMAGMAHAQTGASPLTTSPSAAQPGMSGPANTQNPAAVQNPGSMSSPSSTPGTMSTPATQPQANSSTMNQGTQQVSQNQVLQAQQQLKSAGLYRGTVDGVMGPETQTALSQFQRKEGLPQTAQLDQQTMNRLMNNPGGAATGTQPGATGTQPNSSGMERSTTGSTTGGSYNR